ncbi:MAG: NAD-dependent epimerase/dehydratase family protein [Candidatus Omnitrophica bacterium]|nr:NAD-dependent epimerase/dehydratase family protein [Candidatus Omnitrophota bacterium]
MAVEDKRVFVTGGTGKIGHLLVEKLSSSEFFVKVLTRKGDNLWPQIGNVKIIKGGINDNVVIKEAMADCEYVFHLAVYQNIADNRLNKFNEINIGGTKNILEITKNAGVKKFVYVSTAAVFEPTGKLERDEKWLQKNFCGYDYYLQTKIEALRLVREAKTILPVVVVYPTAVIDPADFSSSMPVKSFGLQRFLWERIGGGIPGGLMNLIGPSDRIFNYVAVEDLVNGIISAALYGKAGEEYILGGENISAGDYLKIAAKKLNKEVAPFRIPITLLRIMYLFGRIIPWSPMVRLIAKSPIADLCLSSAKAKRELNYTPRIKLECC